MHEVRTDIDSWNTGFSLVSKTSEIGGQFGDHIIDCWTLRICAQTTNGWNLAIQCCAQTCFPVGYIVVSLPLQPACTASLMLCFHCDSVLNLELELKLCAACLRGFGSISDTSNVIISRLAEAYEQQRKAISHLGFKMVSATLVN